MLGFLRRRWFLTLLGFLLLAVFIWYAGPYFAFADFRPLESATSRVVLFALIVACWAAVRIAKRLRAFRVSDRLVAAVVRQAPPDEEKPSAEAVQLRERFEHAVATLKQSRRTGQSLYDLPWYVIIGAPGSGKTTALLNSGLKFPLEQRVGRGALRGVGGTRNCDWWFTDEAVFLDTAGRYTTQDSDATSDSAGWGEFLSLLRKYRKRRPINGVILTISAQDLMVQGDRGREAHVDAARRRLNELNRELHIQLPVYVMVTKCDLIAGFSEYFDDLTQEGRAQVWGVTFPYEQTLNGEAAQAYPAEFDQLMARLNARVFARVEDDRDPRRRARVFAFPQQVAALRDVLTQYIGELFSATSLDQQILLRGVYFTSGTQEGTPIDRLLGAIGRRYGVAPEAVVPPTGRGKAYFVEHLLKQVLFGESGLAGVNRRLELQKAALQLGAYVAMLLAALGGVIALSVSYGRNRAYVSETGAELAKLEQVPPAGSTARPAALLPRLNALRSLTDTANQYRDDVPWSMRWGLYQGRSLGNSARDAYVRELDGTLLPRIAARIEERLVELAPEPEKLYEYLKAYLMLGEPKFLKRDHLQFVANLEWNAVDNADPEAAAALSRHFQSLLDYGETLRPIAMNPSLLAQARSTIRQASIPRIVYGRLRRSYKEDGARAVRLDLAAGVSAESVVRRKSGAKLTDPVPSFFSRPVFQEVIEREIPGVVKGFAADDWVWGEGESTARGAPGLAAGVSELYERDYIKTWDAVLNDIELVPFSTTAQAIDSLGLLAGPTSPLKGLLAAIADNTNLLQQADAAKGSGEGVAGAIASTKKAITDKLGSTGVTDKLGGLFGTKDTKPAALPGALVTAHFQPIHRLMVGDPSPIDRVLVRIGQIQHQLRSMGPGDGKLTGLNDPALKSILQSLQDETEMLPPMVQNMVEPIGRKAEVAVVTVAASDLEKRYADDVLDECTQVLSNRYPFTPGSTRDLPLSDFVNLFGYGGRFDKFFRENLEPLVDKSQRPWTWSSGAAQGPRGILDHFQKAQQIRDLFFREGSNALEVKFHVSVLEADAGIIRFVLEIDGQGIPYQVPIPTRNQFAVWPGPNPGTAAVTWYERHGGQPRKQYLLPWGLFHMLDDARSEPESDTRMRLTFEEQGHKAIVVLEATSVRNPFLNRSWQRFSCAF